jgi:hypothetical protein
MRRKQRFLLALVGVFILVLCGMIAYVKVSANHLEGLMATIPVPAPVAQYERITAMNNAKASDAPATQESKPAPPKEENLSEEEKALGVIAHYQKVFDLHETREEEKQYWNAIEDFLHDNPSFWTEEQWYQVQLFLRDNQDLVGEIRSLARQGGPVYPLDFAKGFELELPHLSKMRNFARILRANMLVEARAGNMDSVLEDAHSVSLLGAALKDEPILICQLVRIAISDIAVRALVDSVTPGSITRGPTMELLQSLDAMDYRQNFADSINMETHMGLEVFGQIGRGHYSSLFGSDEQADSWLRGLYSSPLGQPLISMDAAAYTSLMARNAEVSHLPYYEAAPTLEALTQECEELPFYKPISQTIAPALMRAAQAQARHEASLDLAQLGLLLELHAAENGAYPASLDAVAADLGGTLPLDPFTGEAYRYVPAGNTFQLYSIGPNRIDDAGKIDHRHNGDLIWRGRKD